MRTIFCHILSPSFPRKTSFLFFIRDFYISPIIHHIRKKSKPFLLFFKKTSFFPKKIKKLKIFSERFQNSIAFLHILIIIVFVKVCFI